MPNANKPRPNLFTLPRRVMLPPPELNANGRIMYFAFGSNLCTDQMRKRCPGARPLWPAKIEGYQIAFAGYSSWWRGGVATIVPCEGAVVDGYVYDLTPADVARLDGFEGAPLVYSRDLITMTDADGVEHGCLIYVHTRSHHESQPSVSYAMQILLAYKREGFNPEPLLDAIKRAPVRPRPAQPVRRTSAPAKPVQRTPPSDKPPTKRKARTKKKAPPKPGQLPLGVELDEPYSKPHLVFVYGSLLHGMQNHRLLKTIAAEFYGETSLPAQYHMLDAAKGSWPGIIKGGNTEIEGELYYVDDAGLARLDILEDTPNLFTRSRVRTQSGDLAWVYTLNRQHARGCPVVESGSWRSYRTRTAARA